MDDVLIIEPKVFGDHRGWFTETYSRKTLEELGLKVDFVQDNHSFSASKGTLRGLHFQLDPKAQTKLVRCTSGRILDVAVDLRKGSPTYKEWVAVELSSDNKRQLLIPKGFAHGFLALTGNVEVQYKVDEYYAPELDRSVRFDDPEIGIHWGIENPILSDKDRNAPLLRDSDVNFSIKVLVTGASGQLGYDVVKRLKELGIPVLSTDRSTLDVTDKVQVQTYLGAQHPDVVIHCAAYTAVDKAEDERQICYAVNVEGTRNIAETVREIGAAIVYISTDYVFDGSGKEPHSEDQSTSPLNYYGYTKNLGEEIVRETVEKHFIIRTSWLFGLNGPNFIKKMQYLAETKDELSVVCDQVGSPTYTKDLAVLICDMIQTRHYGTYHGVNEGYCSWYEFAEKIFSKSGLSISVNPVLTSQYFTKAKRPLNSRLSREKLDKVGLKRLPHWENALERFLNEEPNKE